MSPHLPDPYQALGVSKDASAAEIKTAYRTLAKANHPDSNAGCKAKEARFKDISAAYNILSDPQKRAQYDAMRSAGPGAIPAGIFDLGDLFAQMFQGGARGGSGKGKGNGFQYQVYQSGGGAPGGFGIPDLGGIFSDGFPASVGGGRRARKARGGNPRPATKRTAGPVVLSDGSKAVARGDDIHAELRVALDQAILGARVCIPTQSGKATIRIPPGTSSGTKLRLRGKGLAKSNGSTGGDHYITVQIDVPKKISDEAARRLVEFMEAASDGDGSAPATERDDS